LRLPKHLTDSLTYNKWQKEASNDWVKEGILLSIYPSSMGRMYKVEYETATKSGNDLVHIDRLTRIIEGKEKPNVR
jgi:thymidylate synthase